MEQVSAPAGLRSCSADGFSGPPASITRRLAGSLQPSQLQLVISCISAGVSDMVLTTRRPIEPTWKLEFAG
jgi:hypothetical protein